MKTIIGGCLLLCLWCISAGSVNTIFVRARVTSLTQYQTGIVFKDYGVYVTFSDGQYFDLMFDNPCYWNNNDRRILSLQVGDSVSAVFCPDECRDYKKWFLIELTNYH